MHGKYAAICTMIVEKTLLELTNHFNTLFLIFQNKLLELATNGKNIYLIVFYDNSYIYLRQILP